MEYGLITVAETEPFQRKMSKAFEEINAGLEDAIKHAKGKKTQVVVHQPEPIDVRAIRKKTGLSQQRFCATFGISLGTRASFAKRPGEGFVKNIEPAILAALVTEDPLLLIGRSGTGKTLWVWVVLPRSQNWPWWPDIYL
jgi:DNA-binding transcriptional regulator YiaG